MRLRLGTRGSALAVAQSEQMAGLLRDRGHDVELVRIKTGGDVAKGSLTRLGGVGVFAAELRTSLLDGAVDFAVHSLKDLPTTPVPGLHIAAIPPRADARDVLIAVDGQRLQDLPPGATVGTGSPRRVAQLRALRPDLSYVDVRGNIGTRLARVAPGDLDAVVLAAAGLARLGLLDRVTEFLDILPAPGQGALALECRTDDPGVAEALAELDDPATRLEVEAERTVLAALGGGCAAPIAAWGRGELLTAGVFALAGTGSRRTQLPLTGHSGADAARILLDDGAAEIADLVASRPSRLADLHDDASLWRGETTLAGINVLLPREGGRLGEALRAAGAEVTETPLQRRVTLHPATGVEGYDWMAVTSSATVTVLGELGLRPSAETRIAAVGRATAGAVSDAGWRVDLVPEGPSTAEALAEAWPAGAGRVVIPGSALSSPVLAERLRAKGYEVDTLPIYTMEALAEPPQELARGVVDRAYDVIVITSGSMARAVDELLGWPPATAVVAFGPPSARALAALGVPVAATAQTQDPDGLIAAVASIRKDTR